MTKYFSLAFPFPNAKYIICKHLPGMYSGKKLPALNWTVVAGKKDTIKYNKTQTGFEKK